MANPTLFYTGNKTKDEIIFLLSCCPRIERQMLNAIHPSYKYVSKVLKELQEAGYVHVKNSKRPVYVGLTTKGMEFLRDVDPASYEYYMRITNNNRPNGSQRYLDIMRRATSTQIQMHAANIQIGSQNPTLKDLLNGVAPKLTTDTFAFYLNREIKYSDEQKEARTQTSRASGVLFTRGVTALVYTPIDETMKITKRRTELEANIRLVRHAKDIYSECRIQEAKDSIILCKDDDAAIRIFNTRTAEKTGTKFIGDFIWNKAITGTAFRYIPMTEDGVTSLKYITELTREEIQMACFTKQEIAAAAGSTADGIINGLMCYEFISCNVTKLAYIKQAHKDLSKVGIICWEGQLPFVQNFFDNATLNARVIQRDALADFLKTRKE